MIQDALDGHVANVSCLVLVLHNAQYLIVHIFSNDIGVLAYNVKYGPLFRARVSSKEVGRHHAGRYDV